MNFLELCEKYEIHPECSGSVGNGWVPVLEQAFQELFAIGWDGKVDQIKEKFGSLRFYIPPRDGVSEDLYKAWMSIVSGTEKQSYYICETCGAEGKRCSANGTWVKTLCRPCWECRAEYFKDKFPDFKNYSWYENKGKPEQSKTYCEKLGIK